MGKRYTAFWVVLACVTVNAQQPASQEDQPLGAHAFGLLSNRRAVNRTPIYTPLSVHEKLALATKDSFDYTGLFRTSFSAGFGQFTNRDPSYGQGTEGYAKRFAASYGDHNIDNMMRVGFLPVLLHEDPRYFRAGSERGDARSRFLYALTRVLFTRTDSGGTSFNFAETIGLSSGVAINTVYHPDYQTPTAGLRRVGAQMSLDSLSDVAKEFWPDVSEKVFHTRHKPPSP